MMPDTKGKPQKTRQFVDLSFDERLVLEGGRIVITLEAKTGRRARLRVETLASVPVEHEAQEMKACP